MYTEQCITIELRTNFSSVFVYPNVWYYVIRIIATVTQSHLLRRFRIFRFSRFPYADTLYVRTFAPLCKSSKGAVYTIVHWSVAPSDHPRCNKHLLRARPYTKYNMYYYCCTREKGTWCWQVSVFAFCRWRMVYRISKIAMRRLDVASSASTQPTPHAKQTDSTNPIYIYILYPIYIYVFFFSFYYFPDIHNMYRIIPTKLFFTISYIKK